MNAGLQRYYLGTDPGWLWSPPEGLPPATGLFVQHGRLSRRGRLANPRPFPRAEVGWALDSGGFTQLDRHGRYTFSPAEYVTAVRRYDREIGQLEWAAPMDWMCEAAQLAKTGLTVAEHQRRTVANFVELRDRWWDAEDTADSARLDLPGYRNVRSSELCPFMPVLQGDDLPAYLQCVDMYEAAGVRLAEHPLVGVGSVCRRSNTREGIDLFRGLAYELGRRYPGRVDPQGGVWPGSLALHAFGVTTFALPGLPTCVESADSRAWCMAGMLRGRRCQHEGSRVRWEQNCPRYAVEWLQRALHAATGTDSWGQLPLFDLGAA